MLQLKKAQVYAMSNMVKEHKLCGKNHLMWN